MGLVWFALAFVIGLVTGMLLRSVVARRQVAAARDGGELRRLQRRVDELEAEAARAASVDDAGLSGDTAAARDELLAPEGYVETGRVESAEPWRGSASPGDDLTRIEGLGPAVSELCEGVGITSYAALAATDVATLRTMLDDAGARYQVHDPTTWPAQARLLAEGREDDFHQLVETIRGGGSTESDAPGPVVP